jgi:competence protein ComEC
VKTPVAIGPALALAGLVAGIFAGQHAGAGSAGIGLVAGVFALLGAWVVDGKTRVVVAMLALALLGSATMQRALDGQAQHALTSALAEHRDMHVQGVLTSDPAGPRFGASALVRVDGAGRTLLVQASGDDAGRLRVLEAGDRVELAGRLEPLPLHGYDARARWMHAVAILADTSVVGFAPASGALDRVARTMRGLVLRGMTPLAPNSRALLAGFLLGDTRAIPDDIRADYRASGLSHLLAVSGANVAFVLVVFAPLLRRLALIPRTVLAITVVICFAAATRFEPSVLRATALATVTILATFVGRPVAPVRALALAIIVLLLIDPFLVHSLGFQLSCAASGGIALFAAPLTRRIPGPAIVRDPLAVSIAAQAGVTPVLLLAFGRVPVVTPIANLLAYPAAEVVGVFGLVVSVIGGFVPPIGAALAPCISALLGWVTFVAHRTAGVGGEVDTKHALILAGVPTVVSGVRYSFGRNNNGTRWSGGRADPPPSRRQI